MTQLSNVLITDNSTIKTNYRWSKHPIIVSFLRQIYGLLVAQTSENYRYGYRSCLCLCLVISFWGKKIICFTSENVFSSPQNELGGIQQYGQNFAIFTPSSAWTVFIPWAWTKTDIILPSPPHLVHVVIKWPLTKSKQDLYRYWQKFEPYLWWKFE